MNENDVVRSVAPDDEIWKAEWDKLEDLRKDDDQMFLEEVQGLVFYDPSDNPDYWVQPGDEHIPERDFVCRQSLWQRFRNHWK